uniref:Uncharacterized protein n=1 Tax=Globodera rostochiensis TaxID=31243 RepID=A0A914H2J3_GLORO
MDTKREGSAWHRYALIEDDKALLAEMPAQVIVSGDKLTLLRDSPAEADIAPVGQLRRDTENGGVVPAAFEQQHCASSVLAQQTMHRNNNAFGGGDGRPFFLDNYQLYTPFRNSPPSAAHHNNSKNTNDGGTNTTTTMTTTSSSTLATIGTNTYNSSSTNGGGARPKLSINADGILVDGNGRILCDGGGGGGSSCGGVLEAEEDNRELVDQLDNQLERFHSHNQQQRLQLLSTTTNNYSNYHRSSEYIPNANANQQQYHQQHNRSSPMGNLPRKLNKKTTRKEKGTDIFVQELDGYFGFKAVEDIMLEFQPQKSSRSTTVAVAAAASTAVGRKKEKAKLAAAAAAASSATAMQLNQQQQSQQQATTAASGRKKAKRVSSTTHRLAQKQRNQKLQQQQQCRVVQGSRDTSTEEMEVSIELDTANADEPKLEQEHQQKLLQQQNHAAEVVVANAGADEGEGQQQPQQKLQQSLPMTTAADEGQSSSSKQKMKPLLERIPKHALRQLYEKKGWRCPITICNPFLNSSGPASDVDHHSVMEGPIAPWLELSDAFPLPAELRHQLQQLQRVVPSSTADCYCFEPKV